MEKVKNLNRDFWGLEEKDLFSREYNYLQGQIPLNAIIVAKDGSCYIAGNCKGASKHFTMGSESRVWKNGSYKIFTVTKIDNLPEHILAKIPEDNFVYKVEKSTYTPRKDAAFLVKNPYEGKSTGICFKFIYDKSTLIECVFVPSSIKKYFKENEVRSKKEIYKEMYETYLKAEDDFDRALLSKMLQKLEKSNKYYAAILELGFEYEQEYQLIRKVYESKALDWFSIVDELYYLPLLESIYGLDMLYQIKMDYMKGANTKEIVASLKELKTSLKFPGICTEPEKIENPPHKHSFMKDSEINEIKDIISKKGNIATYKEFIKTVNLFDYKMIRKSDFKELMALVLSKSTFDYNKVQMMKNLLEIEDINGLMHSVYQEDYLVNINIFNGEKTKASLRWYLNYGNIKLDDIRDFKVIDYKNTRNNIEANYLSNILDAFNTVKRRKRIGRKSNLELYKRIITYFDEVFIEINNSNISFNFKNQMLQEVFSAILKDRYFLTEILKKESFGYLNGKAYYAKLKSENIIFEIINKYTKS